MPRAEHYAMLSRFSGEAMLWVLAYVAATLSPLAIVMFIDTPPGRGFWVEFSAALGFAGLVMLALQFILTARFRRIAAPYGVDMVLQFHRQISLVASGLLLAHVLILFIEDPRTIGLLNVIDAPWRARFAVLSMLCFALLVGLSLWRKPIGLEYERWRISHGLLAVGGLAFGLAHVLGVGHYLDLFWKQVLWSAIILAAVAALVWVRVVKPWQMLRRPYVVERVERQRGSSWSLTLRPEGHPGLRFQPGQFAWLTLGQSPFAIREHPFSFSSSADAAPGSLEMTIKELGDFTSAIGRTEPGARAYLDGPYGAFSPYRWDPPAYVFIAGGVGITPIMSILRTFAERGEERPSTLIYSSRRWEDVIFRDELESLERRIPLRVVHVLREPPGGWQGESGYIDRDLLQRVLPQDLRHTAFFLCAAAPVIAAVNEALRGAGIPMENIRFELFDLV
ncbi:MAG: ferric reductase-like transmembrane domain-containing protein [Candidatus Limnocylindrales bacterium]